MRGADCCAAHRTDIVNLPTENGQRTTNCFTSMWCFSFYSRWTCFRPSTKYLHESMCPANTRSISRFRHFYFLFSLSRWDSWVSHVRANPIVIEVKMTECRSFVEHLDKSNNLYKFSFVFFVLFPTVHSVRVNRMHARALDFRFTATKNVVCSICCRRMIRKYKILFENALPLWFGVRQTRRWTRDGQQQHWFQAPTVRSSRSTLHKRRNASIKSTLIRRRIDDARWRRWWFVRGCSFSLKFHSSYSSVFLWFVVCVCFFLSSLVSSWLLHIYTVQMCVRVCERTTLLPKRHFKPFALVVCFSYKLLLFWGYSLSSNNIYVVIYVFIGSTTMKALQCSTTNGHSG